MYLVFFSESKQEVLANLANFAYDPVNYEYMRTLNVIDLFLGKVIFFLLISMFITQAHLVHTLKQSNHDIYYFRLLG